MEPTYQPVQPTVNPGKKLGIIGFIFAFFPILQIVGVVLSAVVLTQSRKAGLKNGIALAGIIVGACLTVINILFTLFIISSVGYYFEVNDRATTQTAQSNAYYVIKKAELYAAKTNSYPSSPKELSLSESQTGASITFSPQPLNSRPSSPSTLTFYSCSDGNKIGYWDVVAEQTIYVYAGDSTEASDCQLVY
jgi:hypothetical protein